MYREFGSYYRNQGFPVLYVLYSYIFVKGVDIFDKLVAGCGFSGIL